MPTITSKNTSVNSTKVPAIYNKIDWTRLVRIYRLNRGYRPVFYIFDIGCGRNPLLISDFLCGRIAPYDTRFRYLPFDPYWLTDEENKRNLETWYDNRGTIGCIICSNVLNVIKDDNHMRQLLNTMHKEWQYNGVPYFIKIHEGDGSGVGKLSQADCWQRNMKLKDYVNLTGDAPYETSYKEVILPRAYKSIIKK